MVTVHNLHTGQSLLYSCSAKVAVVCADEQSRGNWNTWDYPLDKARLANGRTWFCGDWSALDEGSDCSSVNPSRGV